MSGNLSFVHAQVIPHNQHQLAGFIVNRFDLGEILILVRARFVVRVCIFSIAFFVFRIVVRSLRFAVSDLLDSAVDTDVLG